MRHSLVLFLLCCLKSGWSQAGRYVDVPLGCYPKEQPCGVRFIDSVYLKHQGKRLLLSGGTSLYLNKNLLELLNGEVWSEDFGGLIFKHGAIQVAMSGEVFLQKGEQQLKIVNLNGRVSVQLLDRAEPLPSGFQNWYAGFGPRNEFIQGMMEPMKPESFLRVLGDLLRHQPSLVQTWLDRLALYRANRLLAIEDSSKLYHDILEVRRIASENEAKRLAAAKARAQAENQELRQMLRRRYFEGQ